MVRDTLRAASLVAAAMLAASCGDPPPTATVAGGGTGQSPASGEGTTASGTSTPAVGGYDPHKDPAVNPPAMLEEHDPARATEDEWLYVRFDGNPRTLNAIMGSSTYEFMANGFLYDGPFGFDRKMTWFVNDSFVQSLDISPDRKVWTVKLKPGLKWHDGHPLTAHDIEFSYHQIMDPVVVTPQKNGTDELETVRAIDDLTVQYIHKDPLPTSKWNVLFSILPKHIYEKDKKANPDLKTGDYYSRVNREGIGCGPYRLVEWKENDKLVFERWEEFHGEKPHFKRIVARIIPDSQVALLTFEKGDIDEIKLESKQFAEDTVRSEPFRKVGVKALVPQWAYQYLCWNMDGSNPFFTDVRVRRAMAHAANIPAMIRSLHYNLVAPSYGIWHPDSPMFNKDVKLLTYDREKAAALLDEAGWKVSADTGWRQKDGQTFSFTLLVPSGATILVDTAALLQSDLKSLGVEMKTQIMEWATFQERTRQHQFQASIAAWGTGTDPDTSWNIWHSSMYAIEGGRNYGGYRNDRVDELFKLGRFEFDEAKRNAHYAEIQKLIYDDQPYIFLWSRPVLWGFNKRIRGVTFSPRGVWNFDPSYLAWWVTKSEQVYGLK